ncbi:O-antigen ligase family protein [Pseudomonas fluorescens]|uniref:O-antigen ligase family protein n=1 Tax=Pseudomonas fluorescens TaxID=294 RepID=UPI0012497195|nr:O-antigen ligase family protein [Pseudomonas fluorescens]CAG8864743.1 hypothetical protein PS861_00541 [Pseudomonas fluorescens]
MTSLHTYGMPTSRLSPRYLLALIIGFTVTFNNIEWSFGGNTLTLERILSVPLFLTICLLLLGSKVPFSLPKTGLILIVWIVLTFCSSATGPVPAWSLKMFLGLLFAISFYYMTIWLRANPFTIFKSRAFLLLAWFCGPFLSLIYVASVLNFQLPDIAVHWLQEGSGGTRIRGGITEANLFGVFVSLITLVVVALGKTRKIWWWILVLGLHASLLFSFSRAPWVSYILSVGIYYALIKRSRYKARGLVWYALAALSLVGLIVAASYFIMAEFGDYEIVGRTHSVKTRFIMWGLAAESILKNPFLGNGIYSFSEIYSFAPELVGSDSHRSAWISNLPLALLHDTGIFGLLLFFYFIISVIRRGLVSVRKAAVNTAVDIYQVKIGAALVAFLIAMAFSSQSIPAHSIAIFWVCIALAERFSTLSNTLPLKDK